jgi:hypothetical protein
MSDAFSGSLGTLLAFAACVLFLNLLVFQLIRRRPRRARARGRAAGPPGPR